MTKAKLTIYSIFAAVAAACYWFWAVPFRAALAYREEMQLFLTTSEYFREVASSPLGLLRYAGEFLTQFFNNPWIGASVMTACLLLPSLGCFAILRRLVLSAGIWAAFAIALIPSAALWLLMGNPNAPLGIAVGADLIALALWACAPLIKRPARAVLSPGLSPGKTRYAAPLLIAIEASAIVMLFPKCYDAATYRLLDYDYLVRTARWDAILRLSERHQPELPMSVSATNLALGMTGQLDSRAFHFFQNGPEGLAPPFARETLSSWMTGEIFFHLGMINTAERFAFEGMEAIPGYSKSPRALKRLAETAIIRGDMKVAEKYLKILDHTLFYRKWARRNLRLLNDTAAIDSHPLYGRMRRLASKETYLFSEGEIDKTLGQLFLHNPGNELARQYLIVWPLLQRDLGKFSQYMGVVAEKLPDYNPPLAQQALAFMAMKQGQPIPRQMVPAQVEQQLKGFAQAWTSRNPDLIAQYGHTLFHYLVSKD